MVSVSEQLAQVTTKLIRIVLNKYVRIVRSDGYVEVKYDLPKKIMEQKVENLP